MAAAQTLTAPKNNNTKPPCAVCQKPGRFRCKQCRMVVYCGRTCQQLDYSANHRQACLAYQELAALVASATISQATQDYHVALDAARDLMQQPVDESSSSESSKERLSPDKTPQNTTKPQDELPAANNNNKELSIGPRSTDRLSRPNTQPSCFWKFWIEDFPSLQCLQVLLRPYVATTLQLAYLNVEAQSVSTDRTLLNIRYRQEQWDRLELPCDLNGVRVYLVDHGTALSIRVGYEQNYAQDSISLPCTVSQPSDLACRYCHSRLFNENKATISRTLPLPSGRWDGMEDYLICYEGQTSIDFSSSSTQGQRGTVLESETVVVVHPQDVQDSVSVVAVPGYGESPLDDNDTADQDAILRGSRPWRDLVGGASIAFSVCSSQLGYASAPGTYRLFKHQLVAQQPVQTYSGFVAHELIRYAETKAIFTMFCYCGDRVLLLRLLSWDVQTAQSRDCIQEHGIHKVHQWRPTAKMVFEESMDHTKDDSAVWTWTSGDWCCPPPQMASVASTEKSDGRPEHSTASSHVRLYLPHTEYQ